MSATHERAYGLVSKLHLNYLTAFGINARYVRPADGGPVVNSHREGGDVPRGVQVGVEREVAPDAFERSSFSIARGYVTVSRTSIIVI